MKKIVIIILLSVFSLKLIAQKFPGNLEKPNKEEMDGLRKAYQLKKDSIDKIKIEPRVISWQLTDGAANKKIGKIDTGRMDYQLPNPIFLQNISNTYLGNLGSPTQSNIFNGRPHTVGFLFLKPYRSYLNMPEDNRFFNTRTPFTSLSYVFGGSRGKAENNLHVLHSRNINPFWNIGLSYNLFSADGQYRNQKTKIYDFAFFSSYEKKRYGLHFFINQNAVRIEENGGVLDDSFVTDTIMRSNNIRVNLEDYISKQNNFNILMTHHYGIGNPKKEKVENDSIEIYPAKIVYTLRYESNQRKIKEQNTDTSFFDNVYISSDEYYENLKYSSIQNGVQLLLNERKGHWFKYGLRATLHNEQISYELPALSPLLIGVATTNADKKISNTYLGAGIYHRRESSFNWEASGKLFFEGYRAGNWEVKGKLNWQGGKEKNHKIFSKIKMYSKRPDYLLQSYTSNHQFWDNDFDAEQKLKFNLDYSNKKWKLKAGFAWDATSSYIYFNADALPQQHNDPITVLMAYVKKELQFWRLHFDQTVYCQRSSNIDILPLPELAVYSNNYFESNVFKKVALIRLGIDIHYNNDFYAPAYMPSIGQFYLQKEKKIGNYPEMNIYFNVKVKRIRFFMKYTHFNERIGSRDYFSALHYPKNPAMLKWGVKWHFFD